ncbi:MAG: hypothetical protein QME81_11100, partial [bacterium]|nr:hypothetical protein [bacterium]
YNTQFGQALLAETMDKAEDTILPYLLNSSSKSLTTFKNLLYLKKLRWPVALPIEKAEPLEKGWNHYE